jgi:hypothetical protein
VTASAAHGPHMQSRINTLSDEQQARLSQWVDGWIESGMRTEPSDREAFESAARKCYDFAGIPWPGRVIWVSSPAALAVAAPVAALAVQLARKPETTPDRRTLRDAIHDAIDGTLDELIHDALVGRAVMRVVRRAVSDTSHQLLEHAVLRSGCRTLDDAVGDAVLDEIRKIAEGAARTPLWRAAVKVIQHGWSRNLGGQFWSGDSATGGAYTSFLRESCRLELHGGWWARIRAYEDTLKSVCWWYPHYDFVMACERPVFVHREAMRAGRGAHRLHNDTGPVMAWPDGWGIYFLHGVRVPAYVVERPQDISVAGIKAEGNAEVRLVMIERYGYQRYLDDADLVLVDSRPSDDPVVGLRGARLFRDSDTGLVLLDWLDITPEPDGSYRRRTLQVNPLAYDGRAGRNVLAAMASTSRNTDGTLRFARPEDWRPETAS